MYRRLAVLIGKVQLITQNCAMGTKARMSWKRGVFIGVSLTMSRPLEAYHVVIHSLHLPRTILLRPSAINILIQKEKKNLSLGGYMFPCFTILLSK